MRGGVRTRRVAMCASGASDRSRWHTTRQARRPRGAAAAVQARAAICGVTPFLPLVGGPPGPSNHLAVRGACRRPDAADPGHRLAERLGLRDVWVKNEAANPTHSFKDRVVGVALQARASWARGPRLRVDWQPGQRRRGACSCPRPGGLRVHPGRPRGAEDRRHRGLRHQPAPGAGNYDDVNRLCSESRPSTRWAFVNINMRPYYARAPRPSPTRSPSSSGGSSRIAASCRSPRDRCTPRSTADTRSGWSSGWAGRLPTIDGARPPGARPSRPLRIGRRTSGIRYTRTRSPRVSRSGIRPTAQVFDLAVAPAAGRRRHRRGDPPASACSRETTGIFTETAGGVSDAVSQARRRGEIDPDERVVLLITGDGLKTLDAVRGTFEVHEIEPSLEAFETRSRRRSADGGHGQDPDAAACRDRRGERGERRGRDRRPRCSTACSRSSASCASGSPTSRAALRRFVNVYLAGEDIRFLDGIGRASRTAPSSRSCRRSPVADAARSAGSTSPRRRTTRRRRATSRCWCPEPSSTP